MSRYREQTIWEHLLLVLPQMESFEKLSTFVDLFHYLYYKIHEIRKLDVPQLQGFIQANLREEFT